MARIHIWWLSTWSRWWVITYFRTGCFYQQDVGGADHARDIDLPASIYLFQRIQDGIGGRLGRMILMPAYKHDAVLDNIDDRRRALINYSNFAVCWMLLSTACYPRMDARTWRFLSPDLCRPSPEEASLVCSQGNSPVQSKMAGWLFYDAS